MRTYIWHIAECCWFALLICTTCTITRQRDYFNKYMMCNRAQLSHIFVRCIAKKNQIQTRFARIYTARHASSSASSYHSPFGVYYEFGDGHERGVCIYKREFSLEMLSWMHFIVDYFYVAWIIHICTLYMDIYIGKQPIWFVYLWNFSSYYNLHLFSNTLNLHVEIYF